MKERLKYNLLFGCAVMALAEIVKNLFSKDITSKDIQKANPELMIEIYNILGGLDHYILEEFAKFQQNQPVAESLAKLVMFRGNLSRIMENTYWKWFRITRGKNSAEYAECIAAKRYLEKNKKQISELYAKLA